MADTFQPIGAVAVNLPIFWRYSKIARGIARRLARRIIERQLQGQGARNVPYAQIGELACEYLSTHSELLDCAAEIVRKHPKLSKMAEIEDRERERKLRRRASRGCRIIKAAL